MYHQQYHNDVVALTKPIDERLCNMGTHNQYWFIPTARTTDLCNQADNADKLDPKEMPIPNRDASMELDFMQPWVDLTGWHHWEWVTAGDKQMLMAHFEGAEPQAAGHIHTTQVQDLPEPDDLPYEEYVVPLQQVRAYRFDKDHFAYILEAPTTKSKPMPLGLTVELNRQTRECSFYCITTIGQVPVYTGDLILQHSDRSVSVLRKHQLGALLLLQRA